MRDTCLAAKRGADVVELRIDPFTDFNGLPFRPCETLRGLHRLYPPGRERYLSPMPHEDRAATSTPSGAMNAPEADPNPPLSYAHDAPAWYLRRRPQRWILLVALILLGIWLPGALSPMWARIRFFRQQQYLVSHPYTPQGVQVRFSSTQPYVHTPVPFDTVEADYRTRRRSVGLGAVVITLKRGVVPTLLFSGVLRTAAGHRRMTQIFAAPMNHSGSDIGIQLFVVSAELQDWPQVFGRHPYASDDVSWADLNWCPTNFREAVVTGGTLNRNDPSEVDITLTLDGKTVEIPIHLVNAPPSANALTSAGVQSKGGHVVITANLDAAFEHLRPIDRSSSFYPWPFTGKAK